MAQPQLEIALGFVQFMLTDSWENCFKNWQTVVGCNDLPIILLTLT